MALAIELTEFKNGVIKYHFNDGGSYITLTEACDDAADNLCMHQAYDFKEVF